MTTRKIALVGDWFLPHRGGIEIQMHDLAQQLAAAGHSVHVITPVPGPPVVSGVHVHRLQGLRAPQFGFVCSRQPFRELAAILQHEQYDVVHCHMSYIAPMAGGGAYVSQRLGLPTVVTFHSALTQLRHVLAALNYRLRWSTWPVLFSSVSHFIGGEIRRLVAPKPVHVLPNAVDIPFWQQVRQRTLQEHEVVLITVTRFSPRKRVDALLRSVALLRRRLPVGIRLRLIVVGDGPLRRAVERTVVRLELQPVVMLAGYQLRPAIRELLAQSDIFVSACAIESFGLAALEARCAGLPVVARRSGVEAFITHGCEGFLAEDDAELAAYLQQLVLDCSLRAAMAQHNRLTAPPFGWQDVLPQHLQLYDAAREVVQA